MQAVLLRGKKERVCVVEKEREKIRIKTKKIFLGFALAYCIKTTLCLHCCPRVISSDAKVRKNNMPVCRFYRMGTLNYGKENH